MADWNANIGITALYTALLGLLAARDVDAVTLGKAAYTNPPDGAIAWDRGTLLFKEWSTGGAAYSNLLVSIAGGGTGASTAATARTALGLGSLATQDNNAVNITGGAISGVTLDASVITTGTLALNRGGTGASLGLGAAGTYLRSTGAAVAFSAIQTGDLPSGIAGQFPIGGGCEWFTSVAPTNFVLLDGTAVSRTVLYAALFALWGTTFGIGDGVTTFNLPDMRKRIPIGKDAGTGSIDTIGKTGGAFDHTHTGPSHTHSVPGLSVPALTIPALAIPALTVDGLTYGGATDAGGIHDHTYSGTTSGPSDDSADVQAGVDGFVTPTHSHTFAGTTSSDGSHVHSYSGTTNAGVTHTGVTGTGNTGTGTTGTGTSGAAGTAATGTANPPFFTVNYIARYV